MTSANRPYSGSCVKDLVQFGDRGLEERGIGVWHRRFAEPFQFLLVPQVVYTAAAFGVFVEG
jgi:hypothetical protein